MMYMNVYTLTFHVRYRIINSSKASQRPSL